MCNDLITVIVPTYNTENLIRRAVNSLQQQSYRNIEILIIDDCSTDNTLNICKQLQHKDSRIRILSKSKNRGQAHSRNIGIRSARGKYIMFVDSDDYVDSNFCLTMLNTIKKFNADIAFCDFISINNQRKNFIKLTQHSEGIVNHEVVMKTLITASFMWNKIFSRKILDGIYFPEGEFYEDIRTLYKIIDRSDKIAYKHAFLYFYVQRENSTVHNNDLDHENQYFESIMQLSDFFRQKYPSLFAEECTYLIPAAFKYCMHNRNDSFLYKKAMTILRDSPIPKKLKFTNRVKLILMQKLSYSMGILKCIKSERIYKWIKKGH